MAQEQRLVRTWRRGDAAAEAAGVSSAGADRTVIKSSLSKTPRINRNVACQEDAHSKRVISASAAGFLLCYCAEFG